MQTLDERTWKERIGPELERSVEAAERAITNQPDVQGWVRSASYRAAMSVGHGGDVESAMAAYGYMLDDLRERFPALVAAIRHLTGGCARLDLHWRPLSPEYSRVRLDFGTDFRVHAFHHMGAPTTEAAAGALDAVARHLPKGHPFPSHPNEANGIVACDGTCVAVRVREHAADDGRNRRVTLRAAAGAPVDDLSPDDAPDALAGLVRARSPGKQQARGPG